MTIIQTAPAVEILEGPAPTYTRHGALVATVLTLLAALLVGGVTGWVGREAVAQAPEAVLVGGGQLTDRQTQMADFVADYARAWQEDDIETILGMFTPAGSLTASISGPAGSAYLGKTYWVDDGSLATLLETYSCHPEIGTPILVDDYMAVSYHTLAGYGPYVNVFTFTTSGRLLLVSHEIIG